MSCLKDAQPTTANAVGLAEIMVDHVLSCPVCLRRVLGVNREEAIKAYFADIKPDPSYHGMMSALNADYIDPNEQNDLYRELLTILIWRWFMVNKIALT